MVASLIPLMFIFLILIGVCIIIFVKGGMIGRILGCILILPLVSLILAIFVPALSRVTPGTTIRPSSVTYQTPAEWVISEDGKSIKPWAEDFAKFVNENPQHHWLLAQSPEPCLSVDEAMQKALNQAASQVVSITGFSVPGADESMVLKHLEGCGLIQDRFVQKFSRPYGDVWRASLLVDASSKNMDRLNKAITKEMTGAKRDLRNMIFSTLGLLAVIIGVYYLVDAVTRGYFKTRLRIIAVSFAVIGVFLLLILI